MPDGNPNADHVRADHYYLEAIRAGRAPSDPDQLAGWLLAWRAEVERDIQESYARNRAELLGGDTATAALPVVPAPAVEYRGYRDYAVTAPTVPAEMDVNAMPPEQEHQHGSAA